MPTTEPQTERAATEVPSVSFGAGKSTVMFARDLMKSFGGQTVLDGVSFELNKGEVVLLRGANGSGKTTLLNVLTGHLEPDAGEIEIRTNGVTERFSFPRPWWQQLNPFDAFLPERIAQEGVGRTWQDIRLFSTQSLLDNVAVATPRQSGESPLQALVRPFRTRRDEAENQDDVSEQIGAIGLEGRQSSSADKVSLGQSKRIAILRAVRAGAEVLFLDEPLSGLDEPGIADVMQLLRRLAHEEDITLVIVEHVFNIPRVLELATTVWTLNDGQLAIESPDAVSPAGQSGNETSSARHLRSMIGGVVTSEHRLPGGAVLTKFAREGREPGAPVLEVEDLVIHRGPRLVIGRRSEDSSVQGLSMTLREGEWGVLQAPNGWGKTTLLEAIAGTLPVDRGTIRLRGEPVGDRPAWERDVSLLQSREHAFPSLTVHETLALNDVDDPPDDLVPLLDRRVGSLSGGETQKVAWACTMSAAGRILLLDEPLSALDHQSIIRLFDSEDGFGIPNAPTALVAIPSQG